MIIALCLLPFATACVTVEDRAQRFSHLSCEQLITALNYEKRAERDFRREGAVTGIASIFADGEDEDDLSLDSDIAYLDADDRELSIEAIRLEQQRRCQ